MGMTGCSVQKYIHHMKKVTLATNTREEKVDQIYGMQAYTSRQLSANQLAPTEGPTTRKANHINAHQKGTPNLQHIVI